MLCYWLRYRMRHPLRHLSCFSVLLLLAACSTAPSRHAAVQQSPLLDGRELFGATVPVAPEADILGVSADMRAFVDANGRGNRVDWLRMKHLLKGMRELGLLSLKYESNRTLTAVETFRSHQGNCLSSTNLFVALAREDGLDAQYQVVDVPPLWDAADGWVMLNSHINVLVHNVRMSVSDQVVFTRDYVVDFNTPDYRGTFPSRVVDDGVAFALFYSNRGVEAMREGDLRGAFANFKLAIAKSPQVASVWVNLGALYSRQQHYEFAKAAYQQALIANPDEKSALTNLARLYEKLGEVQLAAEYQARIRSFEDRNPYYHYALAEAAYRDAEYPRALDEIKHAISLKRDDHRLYFLEGLIHYRLGESVRRAFGDCDGRTRQRRSGRQATLCGQARRVGVEERLSPISR